MGKDKSPEDLVKEKSFEYYKVENELQRKFVKQLEYNGFRKKEYYSNDDAAKRLSLLLDIINNFFVDNVKSEYLNNRKDHFDFFKIWRKFNRDVAHIDERIDVLNTVEYVDDNGKIYEQKRYELYEFSFDTIEGLGKRMLNAYNKFSPIYKKIAQREAILRQGIEGEKNLYNRLKIIGNKIRIIQNARYVIEDDFSVEHDMIVISESRAVIYSDLSILCFNLSFGISVEHSFSILFFSSFTFSYSFKCLISEGEYWFSRFLSSLIRKAVLEKVIKEYLGI